MPAIQPACICFKSSRLWVSSSRTRFCSARAPAEYCPVSNEHGTTAPAYPPQFSLILRNVCHGLRQARYANRGHCHSTVMRRNHGNARPEKCSLLLRPPFPSKPRLSPEGEDHAKPICQEATPVRETSERKCPAS